MPRDPIASTPVARSETRVVTVMDEKAFLAWFQGLQDEDQRIIGPAEKAGRRFRAKIAELSWPAGV